MNLNGLGIVLTATMGLIYVQTPQPSISFEVASVKPASPTPRMANLTTVDGGPGTTDPGQITYTNAPLKQLLEDAYSLQDHQLRGPEWLGSTRFDVTAKVPTGATKEQARIMLQNLLQERFGLSLHHEQRDLPIYALKVAKGGCRMKASSDAATEPAPEGFPRLPPGRDSAVMIGLGPAGQLRVNARKRTATQLADFLRSMVGHPVLDETGLAGTYDFTLEFVPEVQMRRADGTPPPPQDEGGSPASDPSGQTTIFAAIQHELGLKLDPRRAPFDILVIDRINQIPTGN
jgi:uncharacterized protein (TIGR03435 family)